MATTLKIKSHPKNLKQVRKLIRETSIEYGFSKSDSDKIALAIDEACTNIIKHAYKNKKDNEIIITLDFISNNMVIHIQDFGIKPDPDKLPKHPPKELRIGGYGLIFIHSIMDEVEYDTSQPTGTILKLVKYL